MRTLEYLPVSRITPRPWVRLNQLVPMVGPCDKGPGCIMGYAFDFLSYHGRVFSLGACFGPGYVWLLGYVMCDRMTALRDIA